MTNAANGPAVLASAGAAPFVSKRRRIIRIKLDDSECTELNYKDIVRAWDRGYISKSGFLDTRFVRPEADDDSPTAATAGDDGASEPALVPTPRTQRFDIIEHLEKRYGGGAVVGPPLTGGSAADRGDQDVDGDDDGYRRGDDEDLYDLDDPFIDDEELHQNIEDIHTQQRVRTKHSGFFVNAGKKIETISAVNAGEDDDEADATSSAPPTKKAKAAKKAGAESSRAVKAFLDDWSDAASDWQPGADILEAVEGLRRAVRELTETTPFTKVFPRQLDDALRAVDVLVVDAHPNKWRVNGYFATLMTFLPFTKQYLKSNMLRLEARDAARTVKDEMEKALGELGPLIDAYRQQLETKSAETLRDEIVLDKDLSSRLHLLLQTQDEWIAKENDYRQMLKTEDKKHMKEPDYSQLNARQERNRIFARVLAMFPPGVMDLQALRGMSKATKGKAARKPPAVQKGAASTPAKSPSATPKRKAPSAAAASVASEPAASTVTPALIVTPVKRAIKPFKSRMMDEAPPFSEQDFDEVA